MIWKCRCISSRLKPIDRTASTPLSTNDRLRPLISQSQHGVGGFLPTPWHPDLVSFGGLKLEHPVLSKLRDVENVGFFFISQVTRGPHCQCQHERMQRVASVLVRLGPWDIYTAKEVLIKRRIGWNQALPVDILTSEFDVKIMFDVSFQKPLCQMTFGVFFSCPRLHGRSAHTLSHSFCTLCNTEEKTAQAWP